MPRGPALSWTQRKQPIVDDYITASVDKAGGLGKYHPQTGHYAELVIRGLADKDEANEWKNALFRCAHYMNRHDIAPLSISAKIEPDGDGYKITFAAVDKTLARAHVLSEIWAGPQQMAVRPAP